MFQHIKFNKIQCNNSIIRLQFISNDYIHYNQGAIWLCSTEMTIEIHGTLSHTKYINESTSSNKRLCSPATISKWQQKQCLKKKHTLGNKFVQRTISNGQGRQRKKNLTAVWSRVQHKFLVWFPFRREFHFDSQTTNVMIVMNIECCSVFSNCSDIDILVTFEWHPARIKYNTKYHNGERQEKAIHTHTHTINRLLNGSGVCDPCQFLLIWWQQILMKAAQVDSFESSTHCLSVCTGGAWFGFSFS